MARETAEAWVQLATRIPKALHRRMKLHCVHEPALVTQSRSWMLANMSSAYIDKLDPESVRLLIEAGFDWQPAIPGFYNRASETSIGYATVRDTTPEQLAGLIGAGRYDLDERVWVCKPKGPLRIPTVDLGNLPPDAQRRAAAQTATARDVLDAIETGRPVTLRELRNVAGEFVAHHLTSGVAVTSSALKRARINPPPASTE